MMRCECKFPIFLLTAVVLTGLCSCEDPRPVEKAPVEEQPKKTEPANDIPLGTRQYEKAINDGEDIVRLPVSWKVRVEDREKAEQAWKIICNARKNQPKANCKLHVVYVTFRNRPALDHYRERYDRILKNIQAYYADQMKENGFPPLTFALDLDEKGALIVHNAHVDVKAEDLDVRTSSALARVAAKEILKEKGVDIENNHVMIICPLEDGKEGPYYGRGSFRWGTCWICDQEDLEPRNFYGTKYWGGRYSQTVGEHATVYIGGIAHELGSSFGLPKTMEGWDYPSAGRSLMGVGSYRYGEELRGEGGGAFLSPSDALVLASVPLFNGMETKAKSREVTNGTYSNISIKPVPYGAVISGKIESKEKCYAVIIHLDPPGEVEEDEYDSNAAAAIPDENGNFKLEIRRPDHSGYIDMRITAMYVNGSRKIMMEPAWVSERGLESPAFVQDTYFSEVILHWAVRRYDRAKKALQAVADQYGNVPEVRNALPMWNRVLEAKDPEFEFSPTEVSGEAKEVNLADCRYIEAKSGWGVPRWDEMLVSELGPQAYFYDGGLVRRFILLHANGLIKFDLGGQWKRLKTQLGVPCRKDGTIRFRIIGDGKHLYTTQTLHMGRSEKVDIDVYGVETLEIHVDDSGNGHYWDWGIIGNPVLSR